MGLWGIADEADRADAGGVVEDIGCFSLEETLGRLLRDGEQSRVVKMMLQAAI